MAPLYCPTRMRFLCLLLLLAVWGCGTPPEPGPSPSASQVPPPASASPSASVEATRPAHPVGFRDATAETGLAFRHQQGTRLWYLPQVTGAGTALFDFDGDGQV